LLAVHPELCIQLCLLCSIATVQVNELTLGNLVACSAASAGGELMALILVHMGLLDCKAAPVAWDLRLFRKTVGVCWLCKHQLFDARAGMDQKSCASVRATHD
jgi:hypothetical protein